MENYGADWKPGSIIEMYGETYRIRTNKGNCGTVEYLDGSFVTSDFYWEYCGDRAKLVAEPEENQKRTKIDIAHIVGFTIG